MLKKVIVILVIFVGVKSETDNNCGDSLDCTEESLIKFVNDLDSQQTLPIVEDTIVVQKTEEEIIPRSREDIVQRLLRYLSTHEIKVKVPHYERRSIEERSRKLKKLILPLLLILKLKAAIIVPAILSVIALISFKGLGASLMALAIAGATAFKSFLEGHHGPKVSYEVVPQISAHLWNRAGIENYPLGQGYHTIA